MTGYADTVPGTWSDYQDAAALETTLKLVLTPELYLDRVIEQITLDNAIVSRNVSLELTSGPAKHLVPIAHPLRGELIDTLKIQATSSVTNSVVGRQDTELFSKLLLQMAAKDVVDDLSADFVEMATSVASMPLADSLEVLTLLRRIQQTPLGTAEADFIERDAREALLLAKDAAFMKLFRFLRRHRPLFVPCHPASAFFKLEYSYEAGGDEIGPESRLETLRALFGHVPYDLRVEVPLSVQTPSYHFRLRAPTNHYVRSCIPLAMAGPERVRSGKVEVWDLTPFQPSQPPSFTESASGDAAGLAHLYIGNVYLEERPPRRMFIRTVMDERPLGQLGSAGARLAIVLAIVLTVRVLGNRLVMSASSQAVTILLALPALLGATTLFGSPLGTIRAPLLARLASFASALIALAGALSFLWWSAECTQGRCNTATPTPRGVNIAYLTLITLAAGLLIICMARLLLNGWHFHVARNARTNRHPGVDSLRKDL